MKNWICIIMVGMFSCDNRHGPAELAIPDPEENPQWVTYEGRVPFNDKQSLYLELSMHGINKTGDGEFALEEFLEGDAAPDRISSFTGSYTILFGQNPDERVIQFHNTALAKGLKRSYLVRKYRGNATDSNPVMIREEPFRNRDLTVKISGSNKLIVLDNQMNAVSDEPEHNLVKGLSKPFTIEGYFRHNGYSADFFEMNTGRNWEVSKYGDYGKASRQYHQLAEKKFDVTYLKGIGFPIQRTGKDGMETEALVIKKVLQMTSAPQINQE